MITDRLCFGFLQRTGLVLTLFAVYCSCSDSESTTEALKPNILLVLTDDQGWGDLRIHGNTNIRTPHLDELCRSGITLSQFFVQPVCSPTRAEILTGISYPRLGVYSTSAGGERMDPSVPTMGTVLKSAGYRTGLFGKWHNGSQAPYHPNFRGFDTFYGFTSGHWAHYFNPELDSNGKLVRGSGYLPDDLTERTIDFISETQDTPFFAMLCFNTPHSPMQVPEQYWSRLKDRSLQLRHRDPGREDTLFTKAALAMVENIDTNMGRLLEYLKKSGKDRNTIVVFLSDNGPNSYRWNGGMKGRKGSTDEGGVRSPFMIRWPGQLPEGVRLEMLTGSIDLLPTLAGLAEVPLPKPMELDGMDLSHFLKEGRDIRRKGLLFHHWNGNTSVRSQDFRLDSEGGLYHMRHDLGQVNDLSDSLSALTDTLLRAKKTWMHNARTHKPRSQQPFTVGYPGSEITYLPARDGQPSGGVKRSNRYPNASYFRNWDSGSGKVFWPVDILTGGAYQAVLYYACPESGKGLPVRLRSKNKEIISRLRKAHVSEEFGMAEDRIPRIESYAKSFRPQELGTLFLEQGTDTLWLEAGPFPNGASLEVQRIVLRKLDVP